MSITKPDTKRIRSPCFIFASSKIHFPRLKERRKQKANTLSGGERRKVALASVLALQTKAQWRITFVAADRSKGFHAPQEAARILAEAIDYARQGQLQLTLQ